jgi:5'-nucleotidase
MLMLKAPLDLKGSRVLISNDDGFNSPGIKKLEVIAKKLAKEVWVVAPETEQSATSHSLTLRSPLRIRKISEKHYAVNGTPTDCILMAMNVIMKECRPDLVLSGINSGSNIGEDMTYSGTIAAAMEATFFGIPAIALSQEAVEYSVNNKMNWSAAEAYTAEVIKNVTSVNWPRDVLINVNFPHVIKSKVTGIEITREGRRKIGDEVLESSDPRGEPYYWIGAQKHSGWYPAGTDLAAIQNGAISVTPLSLDLTHRATMRALKEAFKK